LIPDVQEHVVTGLDIIEKGWWRENYLFHGFKLLVTKKFVRFWYAFRALSFENGAGNGAILRPSEAMPIRLCRYGRAFSVEKKRPGHSGRGHEGSERLLARAH
jgi:hypothetical protein